DDVALTWVDNANNETGYVIERSNNPNSGFAPIATLGADVTVFVDTSLAPGTNAYYRVKAVNSGAVGNQDSAYTSVASATAGNPGTLTPLTLTDFTDSSAFQLNGSSTIEDSTDSGGNPIKVLQLTPATNGLGGTAWTKGFYRIDGFQASFDLQMPAGSQ